MQFKYRQAVAEIVHGKLGPINNLLADSSIIEIMYNPDGKLWVEQFKVGMRELDINYGQDNAILLMRTIASYNNTSTGPEALPLKGSLPGGERFQGYMPPIVDAPSFTIRCNRSCNITLEDYVPHCMSEKTKEKLCTALRERKNIIVSGSTGSGKTTLTSALLRQLNTIAPNLRIITMEDTSEIQVLHKNKVQLKATDEIKYTELLKAALRSRPDRIILGEVRAEEAFDLLKCWNTGHSGGISTIHSNSAASALTRFESLILETQTNLTVPAVRSNIVEAVNLIVHIERGCGSTPVITELIKVNGLNSDATYNTENIIEK